jgi:hypothetical protein
LVGGLFKWYLFPLIPLALFLRPSADILNSIQATAEKIELMPDGKNIRVSSLGGEVRECPIESLRKPTDQEMSKIKPVFGKSFADYYPVVVKSSQGATDIIYIDN